MDINVSIFIKLPTRHFRNICGGRGFCGTEVCSRLCRTNRLDWKPSAFLETPSVLIRRQMEQFVPLVVFIYWRTAVKVVQAPGDQRPTQPNLSNVGHYSPTLLSNSINCLSVCLSVFVWNSALKDSLKPAVSKLNCCTKTHSFTHSLTRLKKVKAAGLNIRV